MFAFQSTICYASNMSKAKKWQRLLSKIENPTSVTEYAKEKNITVGHVQRLCRNKRLKCVKVNHTWFIEDKDPQSTPSLA